MRLLPLFALSLLVAAAAPNGADDRGPGLTGQRDGDATTYAAADFDKVAYGLPGQIEVRVGAAWSVRATGPAAAFDNLRITRKDGTLEIGHRYDRDTDVDLERQLHFVVTLPRVAEVALGGSGQMTVDRVSGPAFKASVGGSGNLTIGGVEVDTADMAIGGTGWIAARGTASFLSVSIGGSGSFQALGLRSRKAQIAIAGSGGVRTMVDGLANVSIVGSGGADLGPNSRCTVTSMGSGKARCGA